MNSLETHRFLKADSPRFGRRDEAKIADEEDSLLVDGFFPDALQFAGKKRRKRVPEVDRQCRGTHNATVVKLNLIWLIRRSNLAVLLQISDYINERGMGPGLKRSLRLGGRRVSMSLRHPHLEFTDFLLLSAC